MNTELSLGLLPNFTHEKFSKFCNKPMKIYGHWIPLLEDSEKGIMDAHLYLLAWRKREIGIHEDLIEMVTEWLYRPSYGEHIDATLTFRLYFITKEQFDEK